MGPPTQTLDAGTWRRSSPRTRPPTSIPPPLRLRPSGTFFLIQRRVGRKIVLLDARKAHLHAWAVRDVYVELPPELRARGNGRASGRVKGVKGQASGQAQGTSRALPTASPAFSADLKDKPLKDKTLTVESQETLNLDGRIARVIDAVKHALGNEREPRYQIIANLMAFCLGPSKTLT